MFKKQKITFIVDVCVENDEDKFHAYCPALKGVHIDGDTEEEAVKNVKIAISLYIQSLIKHGDPIPLQVIKALDKPIRLCKYIRVPLPGF